jgi:cytochrome c oxidase subunit 2
MRPNIVSQTDETMILIVAVSVFLLLVIGVAMIYFVHKFNMKRHPVAEDISGNTTLEVIWTVIPILLVLVMFFYGWKGFENLRTPPENALVIKVTGQMWKWTFEYDNGKKSDTLYVPHNRPIKMEIMASDVNHSFYIPHYRVKEDAIPGRTNRLWFQPTDLGVFKIACAEYCGMNHSYMYADLHVVPDAQYLSWYNTNVTADSLSQTPDSLKTLPPPVIKGTAPDTVKGDYTGKNLKTDSTTRKDTVKTK